MRKYTFRTGVRLYFCVFCVTYKHKEDLIVEPEDDLEAVCKDCAHLAFDGIKK